MVGNLKIWSKILKNHSSTYCSAPNWARNLKICIKLVLPEISILSKFELATIILKGGKGGPNIVKNVAKFQNQISAPIFRVESWFFDMLCSILILKKIPDRFLNFDFVRFLWSFLWLTLIYFLISSFSKLMIPDFDTILRSLRNNFVQSFNPISWLGTEYGH